MSISICVHTMIFNFEIEGYFAFIYVCVFGHMYKYECDYYPLTYEFIHISVYVLVMIKIFWLGN